MIVQPQRRKPVAQSFTKSFDKLDCIDYVNFYRCPGGFKQNFWSKYDSLFYEFNSQVRKEDEYKEFRLVQNIIMVEADFN